MVPVCSPVTAHISAFSVCKQGMLIFPPWSCLTAIQKASSDRLAARCAGLVFGAFALNLVDCGGLLGGRLGDARPPRKHRKSASMQPLQGAGLGERTLTCKF